MSRRDFRKTDRKNPAIAPEDRALITLTLPLPVTLAFALRPGAWAADVEVIADRGSPHGTGEIKLQVRCNRTLRHAFETALHSINPLLMRKRPHHIHMPFTVTAEIETSKPDDVGKPPQLYKFSWLDGNCVAARGFEDPIIILGKAKPA